MDAGTFWVILVAAGVFAGMVALLWRAAPGKTNPAVESLVARPAIDASVIQVVRMAETFEREATGFDLFMSGRAEAIGGKWLNARIAGVSHRNPDGTSRQERVRELRPMEPLILCRESNNIFSKYAVQVCNAVGDVLGYIPETLAGEVSAAMDSGGTAEAYVRHIRQSGATNWGAAIGIAWAAKLSPRNEFRKILDKLLKTQAEEWCWAKLSGLHRINMDGTDRQALIAALKCKDSLQVREEGAIETATRVNLETTAGAIVACLSKQQSQMVLARMRDGRRYGALVFEVRARSENTGLEPVVALILFNDTFSAEIRGWETAAD